MNNLLRALTTLVKQLTKLVDLIIEQEEADRANH